MNDGEKFFEEIYLLDEFKVIQGLCNKGKHFIARPTGNTPKTSQAVGLRVGIGKVGDKLNQKYFLIDGKDLRESLKTPDTQALICDTPPKEDALCRHRANSAFVILPRGMKPSVKRGIP